MWEESGTVLTDVLAAYGYGLLSDPAYIVLRSDRYVNKNVLSVARGSTENRALTPVETWSSAPRDFGRRGAETTSPRVS
ncbi:MAG: hypothetical protein U5N86_04065 [Planctomycetota bacterium]|nr:hypothetical protein [Planctomycetota bacterium]